MAGGIGLPAVAKRRLSMSNVNPSTTSVGRSTKSIWHW